ncbi:serine/threonine-protein kinase RIO3 [Teleopsis dalmanni]|uniref:serine/threonine-protein kinase RIO3 n=1 Tax=Teleopsis dalmanni TaxID=139649 RepID=UPI0018CF8D73|nr:serine/threonine-protein kinase RIO3 [Teleopsis dalmanni]
MSAWNIDNTPVLKTNLADIMSEQYAYQIHNKELERLKQKDKNATVGVAVNPAALLPKEKEKNLNSEDLSEFEICDNKCDSDELIAQMLQMQFDSEYNQELRRIEQAKNKQSKVTISLEKFRRNSEDDYESNNISTELDEEDGSKEGDWDRFEKNKKMLDTIPRSGFMINGEGEMITKHDEELCGVRNACRVMSFPPEFATGDGAGFDMKLSNSVFNQLRTYSRRSATNSGSTKKNKMHDRKDHVSTAEIGVDGPTRLLLYKLINNEVLEQINGVISTGKEAVILHAKSCTDTEKTNANNLFRDNTQVPLCSSVQECAIKVFKTVLCEFKQRDRYIKDDFRFKDRFSKPNRDRIIINMWAEKEMLNLIRMQNVGIRCPQAILLKKHVLVMSFIGQNNNAAPKLKNAILSSKELESSYNEIVETMHKLYNEAKLVHADLSEYNILWHDSHCWFIDVAQSVEIKHPAALEFLMRDCDNVINFFSKKGLPDIYTKEQLFEYITSTNAEDYNATEFQRIDKRTSSEFCSKHQQYDYPFESAWEKSQLEHKKTNSADEISSEQDMHDEACGEGNENSI